MLSYLKYRFKNLINYSKRQNGVTNILLSRQNYENIKDIRDAEIKVFSQNGEDGIIDFILKKLNIGDLKFIEVGVEDYEESNTRFLVETRPTTGLLIDNCKEINFIKRRDFFWKNELYLEDGLGQEVVVVSEIAEGYEMFVISAVGNVGIQYDFNSGWGMILEGEYRHQMNSTFLKTNRFQHYARALGVNTGFAYTI